MAVVVTALWATYGAAPAMGAHADLLGRLANLEVLRHGGNIYHSFTVESFTYPPAAIFLFWPILWIPGSALPLSWSLLSLGALVVVLAFVLERLFEWRPSRIWASALWMAALAVPLFPPVLECLTWGQVGSLLALLVVADYLKVRGVAKGFLIGLATAFKIYPGVFIIIWLWRREWRPALVGLATAATSTALAWLLWPRSAATFWSKQVVGGLEMRHINNWIAETASSSASAFFTRPPFPPDFLSSDGKVIPLVLVLLVGLVGAWKLWRHGDDVSALIVTMVTSVVMSPLAWDHYFVFAPLLLLVPFELGWRNGLARVAVLSAFVMMVPWYRFRRPTPGSWWVSSYAFVSRNALLFAALAVLVTALVGRPEHRQRRFD